jgi:hypothetical protein
VEDLATWLCRAAYYEQPNASSELDEQLARTVEQLRGIDRTQTGRESGT